MNASSRALLSFLLIGLPIGLVSGCSSGDDAASPSDAGQDANVATTYFDLDADFDDPAHFYDFPYPSDLRLDDHGAPRFRPPNPEGKTQVELLSQAVSERLGFPVLPVAYFRFRAPLAPRVSTDVIAADIASPFWLMDVDPDSPDKGTLVPTVAQTMTPDPFVPENVLAIAARPGFVLQPHRKYAFVVRTSAGDATGQALPASTELKQLRLVTPSGSRGAAAQALYAPLWARLDAASIALDTIASATVFTTGDVVADTAALTDRLLARETATIEGLAIDPTDGAKHDRYCELRGTITLPQFQKGVPPFHDQGTFVVGADGLPVKQRDEKIPLTITVPKSAMPSDGYPLVMYFHGSGGDSFEAVDSGPKKTKDGDYEIGTGPTYVVAEHGFAMATSALPISPERVPKAGSFDYLDFNNLPAFRDNFRQGMIEQRLFIRALSSLRIDPATVSACTGLSLPAGEAAYRLDTTPLLALGLSMGGMYTNLLSAIEPTIAAAVPTGAGGYWSHFVEIAEPKGLRVRGIVQLLFGTAEDVTFMHPVFHLFETASEPVEPLVYMPRIGKRPLPAHPSRSIYEPVGKGDQYFPIALYDAIALAYQHPQAGDPFWPSMQQVLKLGGLDGLRPYPLTNNLASSAASDGGDRHYTGAVVQYEGDGIGDPHVIVFQLDAVKYQYGCFFKTFHDRGSATIPAPAPLGTPCP